MTTAWLVLISASASLVLLAWVVYPYLMERRAARLGVERHPAAPPPQAPSVSVILVTKDAEEKIRERLQDLLRTSFPLELLEVIVVRDGPGLPGGLELSDSRFARVVATKSDDPGGKACGLNTGVRAAQGHVLVFTDTHQRFEPEAIPRLVATLQRGPWGIVSGALHVNGAAGTANLLTRYWERERRLRHAEAWVHSSVGVTGAIYAMWRDRWTPLPAGLILDDLFVPMRAVLAGDRVGFEAGAVATDVRTTLPAQEFRRKVRTLTGNLQLCAWLPEVMSPKKNPIWLAFVCHKLLRLLTPYCLLGVLVGVGGLIAALIPSTIVALLALIAVFLMYLVFGRDRLARRLRSAGVWGMTMQAAAIVAAFNGLRGNWDVWRESPGATGGPR